MTTKEAIEIIDKAIAEVEWDYSIEYAAAFDMAKKALEKQETYRNLIKMFLDAGQPDGTKSRGN